MRSAGRETPSTLIVTLTTPELRSLIREEVEAAMQSGGASRGAPPEILNRKEAAALLGVHPRTIPTLVGRGLPCLRRVGNHWRFRRSDVVAWFRSRDDA